VLDKQIANLETMQKDKGRTIPWAGGGKTSRVQKGVVNLTEVLRDPLQLLQLRLSLFQPPGGRSFAQRLRQLIE
jgi:hypothetical protein